MKPLSIKTVAAIRESLDFAVPQSFASYIDGAFTRTKTSTVDIPLVYPGTGEHWGTLRPASREEVNTAVNSSASAFRNGPWATMLPAERQHVLQTAGQKILDHVEELAVLECLCTGLPIKHLLARQIPRAAENFFFFADYIASRSSETITEGKEYSTIVSSRPAGVALALSPWNASLAMASMKIASSTAFGNSCVCKPSEHAPASVLRLAQLLGEAGMPSGVVNVVGGGPGTGMALVRHPRINRISFTGQTENGKNVMAAAAANLTPVQMGLSAKSANIVFADADLSRTVEGSVVNAFSNSGQICVAGSRILVQEEIAGQFIDAFLGRVAALKPGDPMDPATDVGPLGYTEHRDRVLAYIQMARDCGAELLTGGEPFKGPGDSCFMPPTVALVEDNQLQICQDEVFGPFATIQVFKSDDEAIRLCNESRFGLLAYVWTRNRERITTLREEIQVGSLWVNSSLIRDLRAPFGGLKASGIGREGPRECADFYTESKAVIMRR